MTKTVTTLELFTHQVVCNWEFNCVLTEVDTFLAFYYIISYNIY